MSPQENFVTFVRQPHSFLYLLFCLLLAAVIDPMKEGCTEAAVDFLISNLLKRVLTKHKKGTETSVSPEEEQGIDDHDESLNFGC